MLKKIINFIKYSNVFTVVAIVAFVAIVTVVAANEDVKNKIIGEEIVKKSGVDNTALLAADLENFDLKMEITNALEDDENYFVDYQYTTLAIKDSVWREVLEEEQMTISKVSLDGRDLGLHLMEELGEIIDYELAFLKEVQEKEEEKGVTVVLEKTEYTGLIGLVFNTKTKELPGYEPVVKPPVVEETIPAPSRNEFGTGSSQGGEQDGSTQSMELTGDYDDFTGVPEENNDSVNSLFHQWCLLQEDRYWYNETCNIEPESEESASEELARDELASEEPTSEEPTEDEPTEDEPTEELIINEEPAGPADELIEDEPTDGDPADETEDAGHPESEDTECQEGCPASVEKELADEPKTGEEGDEE